MNQRIRPLVSSRSSAALAATFVACLSLGRVARADDGASVVFAQGDVSVARSADHPTPASVGQDLHDGEFVTTGDGAAAELRLDAITTLRVGSNAQLRVAQLSQTERTVQVAAGTVELRLAQDTDARSVVETPSIAVVPRAGGSYRVTVDADGATFVTARSGDADIETPEGVQSLLPGSTLVARGSAADPQLDQRAEVAADPFDGFNRDRDRAEGVGLADAQPQTAPAPIAAPPVAALPPPDEAGAPPYAQPYALPMPPAVAAAPAYGIPSYAVPAYAPPLIVPAPIAVAPVPSYVVAAPVIVAPAIGVYAAQAAAFWAPRPYPTYARPYAAVRASFAVGAFYAPRRAYASGGYAPQRAYGAGAYASPRAYGGTYGYAPRSAGARYGARGGSAGYGARGSAAGGRARGF